MCPLMSTQAHSGHARRALPCLYWCTVDKLPIRDAPFPPHLQPLVVQGVQSGTVIPRRDEKDATSVKPLSQPVRELRNYFLTSEVCFYS